jgi:hypothetical protein
MLSGIHFLLTYACTWECDHCFLYCSPNAEGTFTVGRIKEALDEAKKIRSVEWIYFEGGEPFLYYPIMVEGLRIAHAMGFKTGVVTNCYWATDVEDAALWIDPIQKAGIRDLSLSDDEFHHGDVEETPAKRAANAARQLGIPSGSICIDKPTIKPPQDGKGTPVIGGGALFKGRAADKLTEGLPTNPLDSFRECSHEELEKPSRVHIDPFGHVHICQGVSIGNMWQTPLSELIAGYNAADHPISDPLVRGGPAELARTYGINPDTDFVDECHACFSIRRALVDQFPDFLAPRQVYGFDESQA